MTDIALYIIIGAAVVLAIYGAYYFISKYLEKNSLKVQEIKSILENYGTLYEEGLFLNYTYNNEEYTVQIIRIPQSAKFQFNSRIIWERRIGSRITYTDQTVFSKMPNKKMVIIYPHEGPFTYHYDESEIRYTNPKERIWDMHIIPMHQLEEVLKEGLK